MVMLTKLLKKEIANSRIIIVTDRKDLDSQIHATFRDSEVRAGRATSGQDLVNKLHSGLSIITTLVHKFETVKNNSVTITAPNIFLLVDESHRTQGGDMHKAMKQVFPHGCYLGFTGTPLLKRDKSSIIKFGGLIHRYTIEQAIKDKAVLPLLYEGRMVEQWINDKAGLDRRFQTITRNLNDKQKELLQQKWARLYQVAASEQRLEMIALDINEHYTKNFKDTGLTAILATSSKYAAVKYHELFESYGDIKTAFVISAPNIVDGGGKVDEDYKDYITAAWTKLLKPYRDEEEFLDVVVTNKFVKSGEIELLIVVNKLLTGFDAPRATVLYLDKELKEHGLLQAIARVNRIYDSKATELAKEYGFIIDYRGLLGNLDRALTDYSVLAGFDAQDITAAVIDIKTEVVKLEQSHIQLKVFFSLVTLKQDQESYQVFLADENKRKQFYELLFTFARGLKLAFASDKVYEVVGVSKINQYKDELKFYTRLREAVKLRYQEQLSFSKYEQQMQKLLDTFISAGRVNSTSKLIDIFAENFDKELVNLVGDNAKADTILSAVTKVVRENRNQNPSFYNNISHEIEGIIHKYNKGILNAEEKLKAANDIREQLSAKQSGDKSNHPAEILGNKYAIALYDNLQDKMQQLSLAQFIKTIVQIDEIFKNFSKKPDWQYNSDVKNQIDQAIDDILYELEQQLKIKFASPTEIITTARLLGVNNYAR